MIEVWAQIFVRVLKPPKFKEEVDDSLVMISEKRLLSYNE